MHRRDVISGSSDSRGHGDGIERVAGGDRARADFGRPASAASVRRGGAVVDVIERAHAQCTSCHEIASMLGMKLQTLMIWRAQEQSSSTARVPVRVSAPARVVVVHGPRSAR